MFWIMSILFFIEKLMKLVSTSMWKGGPSWVLYWKNRALELCTCSVVLISFGSWMTRKSIQKRRRVISTYFRLGLLGRRPLRVLQPRVGGGDHPLHGRELLGLLGATHPDERVLSEMDHRSVIHPEL